MVFVASLFYSNFEQMETNNRITIDPFICHGKPTIRGMRWPVEVVLDLLASGMSFDEIIHDHPELEKADLVAALECLVFYRNHHQVANVGSNSGAYEGMGFFLIGIDRQTSS